MNFNNVTGSSSELSNVTGKVEEKKQPMKFAGKTWSELSKEDPAALAKMKNLLPDLFKQLYDSEYRGK